MDAGRHVQGASGDEVSDHASELGGDDELRRKNCARNRPASIRPREQPGEVPHNAIITTEQAESALGRNLATEWDEDLLKQVDMDQRAEEEELTGRMVNPASVDYTSRYPQETLCLHRAPGIPSRNYRKIILDLEFLMQFI